MGRWSDGRGIWRGLIIRRTNPELRFASRSYQSSHNEMQVLWFGRLPRFHIILDRQWYPPHSRPTPFVGGLADPHELRVATAIRGGWYLVRYPT